MNKLCYRVIFNKTRGLLMAVSELGRSHGAAPGADGMTTSAVPPLNAARLQPLAFAVLVLAGAQLLTLPAAQAQIVADPSAPRSQQAVVVTTANGLPQVNITTPSAAGVSRNTYSQFDVNKPGAILNNARNDVQSKLGGWIQRNPNLATGTAGVILNEVNSANPSFLRGYVEVAGDRAQVIIANPSVKLGNDFNRYDYTRVIQESRVSQSDPARIWSGQGLPMTPSRPDRDRRSIPRMRKATSSIRRMVRSSQARTRTARSRAGMPMQLTRWAASTWPSAWVRARTKAMLNPVPALHAVRPSRQVATSTSPQRAVFRRRCDPLNVSRQDSCG
ncbi:ESPR-type extended signal peptide-containing protein [Herbaspirillum huttiense]|nr:ESPR-type extended signal peptide-containing protein [Herbaspirillum huttiense]UWE17455.1 ESPR-type extended signal peptide-containing protein [Herbaspirillum huttiense]